ncbi:hypothetical protein EXIGLDRAFT_764344 [Exidia glandulosa HHB12029]|uniref:Osmotin, thaumatin-like protein n=1 Tax=Exidia glandulosa HHB12029 TaxID=1314781 RepID=A0A165L9B9_EXIGL|nr:hypothetical protein EXIGLDRAFT_764344 [Exidia glandulosa HHB12029]
MCNFFRFVLVLATPVVAASTIRKRDHAITYVNHCGSRLTPVFDAGGKTTHAAAIGPGSSTRLTVAEGKAGWRSYAQTGGCIEPDGGNCTLLECSFDNPAFRQCDISRVDGFNVGITFTFSDPGCAGNHCLSKTCPPAQAFSNATNGGPSIRQCNTPNVGMTVTFC